MAATSKCMVQTKTVMSIGSYGIELGKSNRISTMHRYINSIKYMTAADQKDRLSFLNLTGSKALYHWVNCIDKEGDLSIIVFLL